MDYDIEINIVNLLIRLAVSLRALIARLVLIKLSAEIKREQEAELTYLFSRVQYSIRILGRTFARTMASLPDSYRNLFSLRRFTRQSRIVVVPPGQRLLRLSEILFSPKTVTLTFKPLIADWQFEYFEALKAKRPIWQLWIISIRYRWHYAKACGLSKIVQVFKAVAKS